MRGDGTPDGIEARAAEEAALRLLAFAARVLEDEASRLESYRRQGSAPAEVMRSVNEQRQHATSLREAVTNLTGAYSWGWDWDALDRPELISPDPEEWGRQRAARLAQGNVDRA